MSHIAIGSARLPEGLVDDLEDSSVQTMIDAIRGWRAANPAATESEAWSAIVAELDAVVPASHQGASSSNAWKLTAILSTDLLVPSPLGQRERRWLVAVAWDQVEPEHLVGAKPTPAEYEEP